MLEALVEGAVQASRSGSDRYIDGDGWDVGHSSSVWGRCDTGCSLLFVAAVRVAVISVAAAAAAAAVAVEDAAAWATAVAEAAASWLLTCVSMAAVASCWVVICARRLETSAVSSALVVTMSMVLEVVSAMTRLIMSCSVPGGIGWRGNDQPAHLGACAPRQS